MDLVEGVHRRAPVPHQVRQGVPVSVDRRGANPEMHVQSMAHLMRLIAYLPIAVACRQRLDR